MNDKQIEVERAAFEKAVKPTFSFSDFNARHPSWHKSAGEYFYFHMQLAWVAWQAARNLKQQPYAYIDDKNRLVKISGHVYFDGGFVGASSEIPDSWKTLVLVEKVGA